MLFLWLLFLYSNSMLFGCCKSNTRLLDEWERIFEINKFSEQPVEPELFPESLARVDIINEIPDWYSLVNLQPCQKDDALEQILMSLKNPWEKKRRLIAAAIYAGADPNLPEKKEHPLIPACEAHDLHLIQFLCEHGAQPALADSKTRQRLLGFLTKARIAHYLIEKGALVKPNMVMDLLDQTMHHIYSSKLIALYAHYTANATYNINGFTVFHKLVDCAQEYEEGSPKLLKKCNALLTELPEEVVLKLLKTEYRRDADRDVWYFIYENPEQYARRLLYKNVDTNNNRPPQPNTNTLTLFRIFQMYRNQLEEKMKARQLDVP